MKQLLILLLVSISNGCIPTTPVSTTTVAPNTTTTTSPVISNSTSTTTSTVATTTTAQDACCPWPMWSTNINTVMPPYDDWMRAGGCNQTVTYSCEISFSNATAGIQFVAFAVSESNVTTLTAANIRNQVGPNITINANLTCDTTTHLWNINSFSGQYAVFSCAYTLDGNTFYRNFADAVMAG